MQTEGRTRGVWIGTTLLFLTVGLIWWNAVRLVGSRFGVQADRAHEPLNTLFSGLAFAGVVVAILLQRLELIEQRKELKATTKALEKQNAILQASNTYAILTNLLTDYRSNEMQKAVAALWGHHERFGDGLVSQYEELRNSGDPLHSQRRHVSHFYSLLCGVHQLNLLPPDVLYVYWTRLDLEIIPKIIIPIEQKLEETLFKRDANPTGNPRLACMKKLYDDAPPYNGRHGVTPPC